MGSDSDESSSDDEEITDVNMMKERAVLGEEETN